MYSLVSDAMDICCGYGYNLALLTNPNVMDYDIISYYCYKEKPENKNSKRSN